jgi:4-hydroxyphenylacetate 3-monooxygenase
MAEIVQLLGSSSLMALPSQIDFEGPLGEFLDRYLDTDTAGARDRVKLFHLAWDLACSSFGGRQVLYERYFQGDWMCNASALFNAYDTAPLKQQVQEFLDRT